MKFLLEIDLGSETMKSKADIRWALERVVERLHSESSGLSNDKNPIRAHGGQVVGHWGLVHTPRVADTEARRQPRARRRAIALRAQRKLKEAQ